MRLGESGERKRPLASGADKPRAAPRFHAASTRPRPAPHARWRAIFFSVAEPHARRAAGSPGDRRWGSFRPPITAMGHRHQQRSGGRDRPTAAGGSRSYARADSLVRAFRGEAVSVNELSDVFQRDFDIEELVSGRAILVMTPEKLVYVLRHVPELAGRIGLLVLDEGHQFAVSVVSNAVFSSLRPTRERVKAGDSVSLLVGPTKAPPFVASCSPHLGEVPVKPARSAPPKAAEGA